MIDKAPVVEVFASIQGEGRNLGTPSVFVRFWGCNLHCQFNDIVCDTPYAVSREREKAIELSSKSLADRIKKYKLKHIVFTGGEPMLYQEFIVEVMKYLYRDDIRYKAEVETNGTVKPLSRFLNIMTYITVSPKLKSSNQPSKKLDKMRINYKTLSSFPTGKTSLKFVYSPNGRGRLNAVDEAELKDIVENHSRFDVYIMPEGMDRETVIKNSNKAVSFCIENGFKFSPREHIIIWDKKRGV